MNTPLPLPAPLYPTLDEILFLTDDQIIEALEAAKTYVLNGWTTGNWFVSEDSEDGDHLKVCLEGALIAALWGIPQSEVNAQTAPSHHDDLLACPVYAEVIETLNVDSFVDEDGERVNHWESGAEYNDTEGRTDTEIVDLIDATIKRLRG